jgi:hypothetical protein
MQGNETGRTLVFVGVAAAALIGAWVMSDSRPSAAGSNLRENEGKEFFPEFTSAADATSLRVVTYVESLATFKQFSVEFKDGLWRIPSHHNYPADGKDRLARTANSVRGLKRETWHTNLPDEYEALGVIDPLDTGTENLKGRGQRITISKGSTVLADFIIGRKVKNRPGYYYVRRGDEKSVYTCKLDIDLSTTFSDWIETDLLKVERDEIVRAIINDYRIEQGELIPNGEPNVLTRAKAAELWKLEGMDEATEQVDAKKMDDFTTALNQLKLIGVRPKPAGLSRDLKAGKTIALNESTMLDLQRRGFFFQRELGLVSRNGDVIVGTNKGVTYRISIGEVFASASATDLEVGIEADNKAREAGEKSDSDQKDADGKEGGSKDADKTDDDPARKEGAARFLFITVNFDPEAVGPKPVPPVKPAGEAGEGEKAEGDAKADDEAANAKKASEKAVYEAARKQYEEDLKAYEAKLKQGEEKVKALNLRFADWYYVVSADTLSKLRLARTDIVKPKEDDKAKTGADDAEGEIDLPPELKNLGKPGPLPEADPTKDDGDSKPAAGSRPADAASSKESAPASSDSENPADAEEQPGDEPAAADEPDSADAASPTDESAETPAESPADIPSGDGPPNP